MTLCVSIARRLYLSFRLRFIIGQLYAELKESQSPEGSTYRSDPTHMVVATILFGMVSIARRLYLSFRLISGGNEYTDGNVLVVSIARRLYLSFRLQ